MANQDDLLEAIALARMRDKFFYQLRVSCDGKSRRNIVAEAMARQVGHEEPVARFQISRERHPRF
jgi:hypothetical protein